MVLLPICYKMLEWTDLYLGLKMREDVLDAIKQGEVISKKGLKEYQEKVIMRK